MRKHSIKCTQYIHQQLAYTQAVTNEIPEEKLFLLIAEPETTYPYAVITRTRVYANDMNKDFHSDEVGFNIKVYSDKYEDSVDIADAIRFALEGQEIDIDTNKMDSIILNSSSESFIGDAYLQNMDFTAEVY